LHCTVAGDDCAVLGAGSAAGARSRRGAARPSLRELDDAFVLDCAPLDWSASSRLAPLVVLATPPWCEQAPRPALEVVPSLH
jgi:hypothetical protein